MYENTLYGSEHTVNMSKSDKEDFDEKVSEYIEWLDSGRVVRGDPEEYLIYRPERLIRPNEKPMHGLDLDVLRYYAMGLVDVVLKPPLTCLSRDFDAYWGWGGAIMMSLSSQGLLKEYDDIIYDQRSLIHSTLLTPRQALFRQTDERAYNTANMYNPSITGAIDGFRLASTFGFTVIEGLLKRRCNELCPSKKGVDIKQGIETLQKDSNTKSATKEVLTDISEHGRYDWNTLNRKMNISSAVNRHHFSLIDLLKSQRNYNVHGEARTKIIGSIVLVLCILVVLDSISESEYNSSRENVIYKIINTSPPVPPKHPAAFYPVDPMKSLNL